jgi:hypothetical protein
VREENEMILPSKELLSEVLGFVVTSIYVAPNDKFIEAQSEYQDERINIYELTHKCKEWAFKQGYSLEVFNPDSNYYEVSPKSYNERREEWEDHPYTIAPTEPEAIFKACQVILDNSES